MKTRSILATSLLVSSACYSGYEVPASQLSGGTDEASEVEGDGGAEDDSDNDDDESAGSADSTGASSISGPGESDPSGATDETGSGESGEPEENTLARGLVLSRVEANQGVAVVLNDGSTLIPTGARNAELVHTRTTLVRAFWETGEGWQPRQIEGRLELTAPGGETEVFTEARTIDGPPDERAVEGAFAWIVPAESVLPGVEFSVGFHEVDPALYDTPPAEPAPRLPADGVADFGVASDEMVLKVVVIPIVNQNGGVVVTAENQERLENSLLASYPVQRVEVTYREAVNTGGPLQQTEEGWNILESARDEDNAAPNVYYHLLLDEDTCCANNGQFGWGGIGGVSNDEQNSASWGGRDAMSKVDGQGAWGTSVIIHELGHNHGRPHAPCGGPAGPDPMYPSSGDYASAGIGVQGYNIVDGEVYNPFPSDPPESQWDRPYKDVMSYCWPSWWSDYNWQNNIVRTRILTSWDNEAPATEHTWALRGRIDASGEEHWRLVQVPVTDTPSALGSATFVASGAVVAEEAAVAVELSEGGRIVGIPLDDPNLRFDRVEIEAGPVWTAITPSQIEAP